MDKTPKPNREITKHVLKVMPTLNKLTDILQAEDVPGPDMFVLGLALMSMSLTSASLNSEKNLNALDDVLLEAAVWIKETARGASQLAANMSADVTICPPATGVH